MALAIAVLAAVAPTVVEASFGWRGVLPSAIAPTALLMAVGSGGLVWALPILDLVVIVAWCARGMRATPGRWPWRWRFARP